jgi:hypothetical protein
MTPIEIVEQEAELHGVRFTKGAGLAFLLGFLIGRDWSEKRLGDEEALRAWLRGYFESTGRRRKKEVRDETDPGRLREGQGAAETA